MKKKQRLRLAARLRQMGSLVSAGVAPDTALAVSLADNLLPSDDARGAVAAGDVTSIIPDEFSKTRSLIADAPVNQRGPLLVAMANVLDAADSSAPNTGVLKINLGMIGVICLLFTFVVVPGFQDLFDLFGGELPVPTRLALQLSNWLLAPVGILIVAGLVIVQLWQSEPQWLGPLAGRMDRYAHRVPFFGRGTVGARTCTVAAWLAASGGGDFAPRSLACLIEVSGPGDLGRRVAVASQRLAEGDSLAAAFSGDDWCPGLGKMLETHAGEAVGLNSYANSLDVDTDTTIARFTMVSHFAVGLIVGFFVIAMYLPIFKMGSAV